MTHEELRAVWKKEEDCARIIEWEFPGFSVDGCFDRLLKMQETIEREGRVSGTVHRYLIVAKKPEG